VVWVDLEWCGFNHFNFKVKTMNLNLDSKNITQTVKKLSLFICMIKKKKSAKTERKRGDSRYKCQLESTEKFEFK